MSLATQYDQWHQRVFDSCPEHADESSPWYELVLEHLAAVKNKRVLEIACGRGGFSRTLAARGAIVFGSDFSASALRIAQQKISAPGRDGTRVALTQADAHHLPYATASFDMVISCETIEHLVDPRAALAEMARVCKPDGLLYLTTPNYANLTGLYVLYANVRHRKARPNTDQPLDNRYLFFQVRRFLHDAGWRIIYSDGTVHQFPVVPGRDPIRANFFEASRRIRRWLSPLALHYFVVAQKRPLA